MIMLLAVVLTALATYGQIVTPVHFTTEWREVGEGDAEMLFRATIDEGWHVYDAGLEAVGPTAATLHVQTLQGAKLVGPLRAVERAIEQYDPMFAAEVRYHEHQVTFVQRVHLTGPRYLIDCSLEYGVCSDRECLPPMQVNLKKVGSVQVPNAGEEPDSTTVVVPEEHVEPVELSKTAKPELWAPVVDELRRAGGVGDVTDHSLWYVLLMGLIGGLLAVLMPCIWPIIPMTVSFFLKRAKDDRRKGLRDAVVYGVSIVIIYLGLGLLVTALFGADTLNAMSTNAVFNVAIFLLLVVFALSLFGWFEISLPDSWTTTVDAKADELSAKATANTRHRLLVSYVSIFLMAFTLVLVSFSCTVPIVGLLLVETATTGNWLAPSVGMLGFAVALALPFTLFALFPSWLQHTVKSGAWMNTLKVVLAFVELAFSLKFLSVADQAYGWHLLSRELFIACWVAIFLAMAVYLFLRRHLAAVAGGLLSLAFAAYLVPGLWGAPVKVVSAFAPPMDFDSSLTHYTDYDEGMAAARRLHRPVLLDFTGYGCVNCRKMEAAVWTDPQVAKRLTDYVVISLYVDDKTPLAEPLTVTDAQGRPSILRTVGARWSYLQTHKFGANAQPFYVLLDTDGHPLDGSRAYDEDAAAFASFLERGLQKFRNR